MQQSRPMNSEVVSYATGQPVNSKVVSYATDLLPGER